MIFKHYRRWIPNLDRGDGRRFASSTTGASVRETVREPGGSTPFLRKSATLATPSWNQLVRWLRTLDLVRKDVAA